VCRKNELEAHGPSWGEGRIDVGSVKGGTGSKGSQRVKGTGGGIVTLPAIVGGRNSERMANQGAGVLQMCGGRSQGSEENV